MIKTDPLASATAPPRSGSSIPDATVTPYVLAIPFEPPFDFTWQYHLQNGGAPDQSVTGVDGQLIVNVKSGNIVGGADRFVNAHCGVGCVFDLTRTASVRFHADLDVRHKYLVDCRGVGGWASVDGGVDAAFMRGSEALILGTTPVYHRRVSGFEDDQADVPFTPFHYPNGMGCEAGPGTYAYNLGIWAVSDYANGVGSSAAQSACQARIHKMLVTAI